MNLRLQRKTQTAVRLLIMAAVGLCGATVIAASASAQDDEANAILREGAAVYSQTCSACHQPGGIGLEPSFPPLIDNSNIDDPAEADYLRDVVNNGLDGEIVAAGTTYNGVMPAFSTLSERDVDALVFYIQSGFQAPSATEAEASAVPAVGTESSPLVDVKWITAYLIAALIALFAIFPRLRSRNSRLNTPWLDVWLKAITIFIAIALAIAFVPNWVMQTSTVAALSRPMQDLVGVSVWGLGLGLCLGVIWFAHRDSRL